jgi:hypothetical protein
MYRTIEAELKNGHITSLETGDIPTSARVLITFLDENENQKHANTVSMRGSLNSFSNPSLIKEEKMAWKSSAMEKHEKA